MVSLGRQRGLILGRSNSNLPPLLKITLLPFGSAGDVLPFLWLARHLQTAGHQPALITASLFQSAASAAGIPFIPVGRDSDFESLMRDPRIWRLGHGTKAVFEYAAHAASLFFDAFSAHAERDGRPDLLLAPVTAFGARLAREKAGIPLVTVHLQPAVLLSSHDTPVIVPSLHFLLSLLPAPLKRLLFRFGPNPVDLFAGPALRRLCLSHAISPPRRFFNEWWDSPDGSLLLFPEWFAPPQPDWPQPRLQTPFPLEDLASENPLPPDLQAFLSRHHDRPPVVFTAGSANVQAAPFFCAAAAALEKLRRPGVFVTRDLAQLPHPLPSSIFAASYTPFGPLLRHSAAFVHHGGIGTLSQGFSAGIPQLLMPMAHDQPDNARRLVRLRAGAFLNPSRFTPENVSRTLASLLNDPLVLENCRQLAVRSSASQASAAAPGIIDWLLQRAASTSLKPTLP